MITTMYGQVPKERLREFERISGNKYKPEYRDWAVMTDEVEYYQLKNANSIDDNKKWEKKEGWLPIRDLNFQYAYWKNNCKLIPALELAKEKLFDTSGRPIYLPEALERKAHLDADVSKKPVGYNTIIEKEIEAFKQREERRQVKP